MIYQEEIREQLKVMSGWCDPAKGIALAELIVTHKLRKCLEIGVFSGKSLLSMAFGLRENGYGIVHGIDSWEVSDCVVDVDEKDKQWWSESVDLSAIYEECLGHIHNTGLGRYVTLHRCQSMIAAKFLDGPFELIHIDGCHSEWSSTSDVTTWLPRLISGGVLVMDDVNWPSTQTAIRFARKWCDEITVTTTPESIFGIYRKR